MLEPEANRIGLGDGTVFIESDPQDGLPVVVRNRATLAVRPFSGRKYPRHILGLTDFFECSAGGNVDGFSSLRDDRSDCLLQLVPDASVKSILDLRRTVDGVVCLLDHRLVILPVPIRNLVSPRVVLVPTSRERIRKIRIPVVDIVAGAPGVNLIGTVEFRCGAPIAAILGRSRAGGRIQGIRNPQGRVRALVV